MRNHWKSKRRRTVVRGIGATLLGVGLAGCANPGGEGEGEEGGEDEEGGDGEEGGDDEEVGDNEESGEGEGEAGDDVAQSGVPANHERRAPENAA